MINTSEKVVFHVSSRQKKGTANVSRLRNEGKVPANIYGLGEESIAIMADYQGIRKLYDNQGETGLIYLQLDDSKKQIPVLIDEVASVKIGEGILHVSFKRVNLNVKIEAEIPVEIIGETKIDNAIVSVVTNSVLIEAFPADLPDNFEIDISNLTEVGQSISLADLKFDKSKISLVLDDDENPEEILLVNVQEVKEEVEPEEPVITDEEIGEDNADESDKESEKSEETGGGDNENAKAEKSE